MEEPANGIAGELPSRFVLASEAAVRDGVVEIA
jgi:hypothetical protein